MLLNFCFEGKKCRIGKSKETNCTRSRPRDGENQGEGNHFDPLSLFLKVRKLQDELKAKDEQIAQVYSV